MWTNILIRGVTVFGLANLIVSTSLAATNDDILDFIPAIIAATVNRVAPDDEADPTPIPDGVTLLPTTILRDFFGDVLIVGEVFNNTSSKLEFVEINANIFNGNSLVATEFTFTEVEVVPARSKACFKMFTSYGGPFTNIQFEPLQFRFNSDPRPNITATNLRRDQDSFGDFQLLGSLQNNGSSTVGFVKVIATMYGFNDKVIDCDFIFSNNSTLAPGQSSGFDMFTFTPASQVKSFTVQTDGRL